MLRFLSPFPFALSASVLGLFAIAGPAFTGQVLDDPTLRTDIELAPAIPAQSSLQLLARSADRVLFQSSADSGSGSLWLSDGLGAFVSPIALTTSGEEVTLPALPFENLDKRAAALPNGDFVVVSGTASVGNELLIVDAQAGAATVLADLLTGPASSDPAQLVAWSGRVWFIADDGTGDGLYSTDGAGVQREFDLSPTGIQGLYATGGSLFLSNYELALGIEPTDGLYALAAPGGTLDLVRSGKFGPSPTDVISPPAVSIGNRLFFSLDDGVTGNEPWVTDGTVSGTQALGDVNAGSTGSTPKFLAVSGQTALFVATSGSGGTGREYYLTDGTPAGTALLADIWPGIASGALERAEGTPGGFVFTAVTPALGTELWSSTTVPGSAQLVADLDPGPSGSLPGDFLAANGAVLFRASSPSTGEELFVTDGTPGGTGLLLDLLPGPAGSGLRPLAAMPWGLFALANSGDGQEPHRTDGTLGGTVQLANVYPDVTNESSEPAFWLAYRDQVVLGADTEELGRELYRLDPTDADATLVADLQAGAGSSEARPWIAMDDRFLTVVELAASGVAQLWGSTSVPGSAEPLAEVEESLVFEPSRGIVFEGRAHVLCEEIGGGPSPYRLLATDGTAAGTEVIFSGWSNVRGPVVEFDGALWFGAATDSGVELWTSDGTTAGTRLAFDLDPGPGDGLAFVDSVGDWLAVRGTSLSLPPSLLALDPQATSCRSTRSPVRDPAFLPPPRSAPYWGTGWSSWGTWATRAPRSRSWLRTAPPEARPS